MRKILLICSLLLCGCTQILYEDPKSEITVKVNHFLVDREWQGFEWVFAEDNYVSVNGLRTKSEMMAMLQFLFEAGLLRAAP